MNLHYLQLNELADLLRRRELTSVEVTRAQLERIDRLDGQLASYTRTMPEQALVAAQAADAEIASGRYRGPLHGVPLGIKDLFWTKGVPTAGGTTIRRDFVPAEDATVVARLKRAGAVVLGKLQMTEGAYSDHHPAITPPKNPWNPAYWTGISSSGAAVATAAGLCYGALASDTGGSIRWPCGATGLSGIKPAWGRVSRFGVLELAASLDHVGPIARSVADAAAILTAIAGPDGEDPTTLADPPPEYVRAAKGSIHDMHLGVDARWNTADVVSEVRNVLVEVEKVFRQLGAEIVPVSVPDVTQAVADWAPACALEAAFAHRDTYPARKDEYGAVLASVLDAGSSISALDYQAIRLRRMDLRGRFAHLFRSIDALLVPVQPFAPLTIADISTLGAQPDLILKLQRYTAPFDLTGHPTVTLPGGFSERDMPIGIQLAGRDEATLIRAAVEYQQATPWHKRHPLP
ncbi:MULTISPECIES: amidase [unclassified Sinorhizobium]|uniref:amidase n=1 Tax=unclassified Sinorhizobium TaxID=2613772 RepID=UPI00352580DF